VRLRVSERTVFDLLDRPYLFDTEPSFTEGEFPAWRGLIWALSYLPEETAIPALQQVVEKCFATSLIPNHAGWNYARQGYLGATRQLACDYLSRDGAASVARRARCRW
jgi:hypothetical protein